MLTKNFSRSEAACPCCGKADMDPNFMIKLQKVRDLVGEPLTPSSMFRCAKHNSAVRGAPASHHLFGRAADILIKGDKHLRYKIVKAAMEVGMGCVEVSPWHVHMDDRDLNNALMLVVDDKGNIR